MTRTLQTTALALGMLLVACSGNVEGPAAPPAPVTPNAGNTIPLYPSKIIADHSPAQCGTAEMPYTAGDLYMLELIGDMTRAPFNGLTVNFTGPVPIGQPLTLTVKPLTVVPEVSAQSHVVQSADNGRNVSFIYDQGSDPAEIDTGAFDSSAVTVVALPAKDGDPLTIRIQAHFVDGRVLDETFSAAVVTTAAGCGAG